MNKSYHNTALVVLSTDSYSDSWNPFFLNFSKHWNSFVDSKYLITDSLNYSDFDVITINPIIGEFDGPMDWAGRILSSLNKIKEDNLIIFLEDYILIKDVNIQAFNKAFDFFKLNNVDFLSLGTHDLNRKGHHNMIDDFVKVKQFSRYKITTSPGIWKKKSLIKYLIRGINPWQFEIIGSYISCLKTNDSFFMLNRMKYNLNFEILPYFIDNGLDSAIVRGKWQKGILNYLDHSTHSLIHKRGLLDCYEISKIQTFKKLINNPILVVKYIITVLLR